MEGGIPCGGWSALKKRILLPDRKKPGARKKILLNLAGN
jgi:hypothetical protein